MANIVTLQQASIPIKSNKLFVGTTYYYGHLNLSQNR